MDLMRSCENGDFGQSAVTLYKIPFFIFFQCSCEVPFILVGMKPRLFNPRLTFLQVSGGWLELIPYGEQEV